MAATPRRSNVRSSLNSLPYTDSEIYIREPNHLKRFAINNLFFRLFRIFAKKSIEWSVVRFFHFSL